MIVTIDGPAGVGKTSSAKALARRLGFAFLNTGAMFRAVALAARRAGAAWDDDDALSRIVAAMHLELRPCGAVLLDGEDVSSAIVTPEISQGASKVAASGAVRPRLAELQRLVAHGKEIVTEGRDQGTVVFPDAGCKFFLTATPEVRLARRARQLENQGKTVDLAALRAEQAQRDERDSTRALAPLRAAADAVTLDTSDLGPDEVASRMEAEARRRLGAG